MLKGFTHARLACGCRIAFREGVEGSPVTVVVDEKGTCCVISLHVRDLPLYDYREARRRVLFRSKKKSTKKKGRRRVSGASAPYVSNFTFNSAMSGR